MFGIAKADKFSQGSEKNVKNVSSRPAKKHKNMRNRQIGCILSYSGCNY
jgi:hypothetical protein